MEVKGNNNRVSGRDYFELQLTPEAAKAMAREFANVMHKERPVTTDQDSQYQSLLIQQRRQVQGYLEQAKKKARFTSIGFIRLFGILYVFAVAWSLVEIAMTHNESIMFFVTSVVVGFILFGSMSWRSKHHDKILNGHRIHLQTIDRQIEEGLS